jgi:hypothetical protein
MEAACVQCVHDFTHLFGKILAICLILLDESNYAVLRDGFSYLVSGQLVPSNVICNGTGDQGWLW